MRRAFKRLSMAALCMVGSSGARADESPASRVRVRITEGDLVLVPVRVGGRIAEFLLDTGSSATIVSPRLAESLRLPLVDRVLLTTLTGERAVPRALIDELCVGRSCVGPRRVTVAELSSLSGLDERIEGILGADVLTAFDIYLDVEARALMLTEPRGLASRMQGARVPIAVSPRGVSVGASLCDATGLTLRLDSGASGLVLFGGALAQETSGALPDLWIHSDGPPVRVRQVEVPCLAVGGHRLSNVAAAVTGAVGGRRDDGLLPLNLFKGLYLNASAGYAVFDPRVVRGTTRAQVDPSLGTGVSWE